MKPYNHDIYLNGYKAVTFEGPLRLGTYDSYGNERIRVLCSPEWDGLTIVATFKAASAVEVLVDADGMLDVPPEATATQQAAAGRCALTFVGTGEGRQVISCTTYYLVPGPRHCWQRHPRPHARQVAAVCGSGLG